VIINLRAQLHACECELQDALSNYDRDKQLWEGKRQFLEQQLENYKRDLVDQQNKFSITITQLQKRHTSKHSCQQQAHEQRLKSLQDKHSSQL